MEAPVVVRFGAGGGKPRAIALCTCRRMSGSLVVGQSGGVLLGCSDWPAPPAAAAGVAGVTGMCHRPVLEIVLTILGAPPGSPAHTLRITGLVSQDPSNLCAVLTVLGVNLACRD